MDKAGEQTVPRLWEGIVGQTGGWVGMTCWFNNCLAGVAGIMTWGVLTALTQERASTAW